jgi:diaminopimelate epimerase
MAAGHRLKRLGEKARISLPGGDLFMAINPHNGHVLMTGPAAHDFDGVLPAALAEGLLP